MKNGREVSRIELGKDGLVVHLGPESRLVRLGQSTVLVAEPDGADGDELTVGRMLTGDSTISCICRGTGSCQIQVTTVGEGVVNVKCVPTTCGGPCSRLIIDRFAWDEVFGSIPMRLQP